jgi:uncharacterized protein YebE (UPF0316 family)
MALLVADVLPLHLTLPVLIFLAEMCVVTLATIRIIFIARGLKLLATVLGFFEVAIWLFAIGQIMQNLTDMSCYAAFAAGFTAGNFLGILIEKKLAIGTQVVRIITNKDTRPLLEGLRAAGYGVTCLDGEGATGPVRLVFTVIQRKELEKVLAIIRQFDPRAFYSIDDVRAATEGVFPRSRRRARVSLPIPLGSPRAA